MTVEKAVGIDTHKSLVHEYVPRHRAEKRRDPVLGISDVMHRTLLGVEIPLKEAPQDYNIGEISLNSTTKVDFSEYNGSTLKSLQTAQHNGDIEVGVPYIASGVITVNDEQEAMLKTSDLSIHLGQLDSEAQKLLREQLAGYEMVLPLVIDSMVDGEAQARVGEKAAYLIPNPDRKTRRRLRKIQGRAMVEGWVRHDKDQEDADTVTIQTTKGGWLLNGKKTKIVLDEITPTLNQGTDDQPTKGEPLENWDKVRAPVEFVGRAMYLTDNPSLIVFSSQHEVSYRERRQVIDEGLRLFQSVITDLDLQTITRLDGKVWDVSEPDARDAIARYLFAELRQKQDQMTPTQQEQLSKLVFSMDSDSGPFIFNNFGLNSELDPRRQELDDYFRETTPEGQLPKLSEAMTPEQLLHEMIRISSEDDFPPPFATIAGLITDYQERFDQDALANLVHQVVISREYQLRAGENPYPALSSLWEIEPYMKNLDPVYQTEWFAHFIHAGKTLAQANPEKWDESNELYQSMRRWVINLESLVYADEQFANINYETFFTLVPFSQHMKHWQQDLPYNLGEERSLVYILRDLQLINETRKRVYVPESNVDKQVLELVAGGLRKL